MTDTGKYYQFQRQEWQELFHDNHTVVNIDDLNEVVSLNDRLTQADVREIYRPLLQYIDIFLTAKSQINNEKQEFLQTAQRSIPFVIGISGSVAVGKSTVARVLQELLSKVYPNQTVDMMTTDGFLYPNHTLERMGLTNRKGFPESYDMVALLEFMTRVKSGQERVEYPLYSHDIYDVISDQKGVLERPDILIVEGINIYQLPQNQQLYVSDFFDFSLYVDAEARDIKSWFYQRFQMHLELAKEDPSNFYYPMTFWSEEKLTDFANEIWYTINLTNLVQYIAPTKERAHVILHKQEDHQIDTIWVRKY